MQRLIITGFSVFFMELPSEFFLCDYAHIAPLLILGLLILGGLNFPISEDLVLILAGATASLCIPEHKYALFVWTYFVVCLSSWETYWIGRILGPKLYQFRWFNRILTEQKIARLHNYYERYGIFVFIVGRFFPGGVRNALFLSSGLGKMPFPLYIIRDGFAALISTTVLFYLGFIFGQNYQTILHKLKIYDEIVLGIIIVLLVTFLGWFLFKSKKDE